MSERLIPEREAEIRNRRLDEVTPGPWLVADGADGKPVIYIEQPLADGQTGARVLLAAGGASEADVQFVASARRSVPELLAELAAVRKERDEARAALREAADQIAELEHEIGGWSARVSRMNSVFTYGSTKPYHKGWNDAVARVRAIAAEDAGAAR